MPTAIIIPDGTPTWISEELIQETLRIWQPYYAEPLAREDAIAMISTVGGLFSVLSQHDNLKEVCSSDISV